MENVEIPKEFAIEVRNQFAKLTMEVLTKTRLGDELSKSEIDRIKSCPPDEIIALIAVLGDMIAKAALSPIDAINLGRLIYAANPYKTTVPNEPYGFKLDLDDVEQQEEPGNWKFKYGELYVQRAIRVPYSFTPAKMKDIKPVGGRKAFTVRDYFLVGFEGGAGY